MSALRFEIRAADPACSARTGFLHLPHGSVRTPAFMPVGTQGSVKGLLSSQVRDTGADMILEIKNKVIKKKKKVKEN